MKTRVGSWDVGTLTGKGRGFVDLMRRKRVEILCVQETKLKENNTKELGERFKLYYSGKEAKKKWGWDSTQ